MRRHISLIMQAFTAAAFLCLAVPFAVSNAYSATQAMFIDRQADARRHAEFGEVALLSERSEIAEAEFAHHFQLFGVDTALLDRYGRIIARSRPGLRLPEAVQNHVMAALSGKRPSPGGVHWPWNTEQLVVAVPIVSDDETIGVTVTLSPTDRLRRSIMFAWLLMLSLALLSIMTVSGVVRALSGWIIRPILKLDDAAKAITDGELSSRVPIESGPLELRGLARSFNTMCNTVEVLVERQRSFVNYASHQLRSPLTVLRLEIESLGLCRGLEDDDRFLTILDEVDRLALICRSLLSFAEAGTGDVPVASVDLAAIADQRVQGWQMAAIESKAELYRTGDGEAPVRFGQGVIDQILDALIDNALKFSGPEAKIVVHVERAGDWLEARVIDNGPGMTADEREYALDPFWRGRMTQNTAGCGLGLAICATLAAHFEGEIELREALPHGLEACLRVPLREHS